MITTSDSFKSSRIAEITRFSAGVDATVVAINADRELQGRLMGLGLFVGSRVHLFQGGQGKSGPLLLGIDNTRIALGRDVARTIIAEIEN